MASDRNYTSKRGSDKKLSSLSAGIYPMGGCHALQKDPRCDGGVMGCGHLQWWSGKENKGTNAAGPRAPREHDDMFGPWRHRIPLPTAAADRKIRYRRPPVPVLDGSGQNRWGRNSEGRSTDGGTIIFVEKGQGGARCLPLGCQAEREILGIALGGL